MLDLASPLDGFGSPFGKRRGDPILAQVVSRMNSSRVDFLGIGDSNQVLSGHGWDHGFQYALSRRWPMWATGLVSQNENNGNGSNQGYLYNRAGALIGAVSGATAELDAYLNKGSGSIGPAYYTYIADGGSLGNTFSCGLVLQADCPIDNGAALAFDIHYGTFTTGAGQFKASVRLEQSPFSLLVANSVRSTNTGAYGMAVETVTLSADATRSSKAVGGKPIHISNTGITGPYFNTYYRFRNPSRLTGFSYGSLDYHGGASLRYMANDLQQASDTTLTHYFTILRNNQNQAQKTFVICINGGLNDRGESGASLGGGAITPGDSAAAYADNYTAIRDRIRAIWTLNGWDAASELFFITFVSHPVSTPDDTELVSYRAAVSAAVLGASNETAVSLTDLTDYTEMDANSWYLSGVDRSHLSQAGYENLSVRIISRL